ncbi:MAG: hypothetical protein R3185_04140, partial [Candidatus Thermoplasmatota archaeon]|nr:hypothetical protein [Candidatus Thermoplasmatota archaeon]
GENVGALAILRDYSGNDTYTANLLTMASSEDGAYTLFTDDKGEDTHHIDSIHSTSLGQRYKSEGGYWAPGNKGIAYYLDGDGEDTWTWSILPPADPSRIRNDHTQVDTNPDNEWSIFVDCTTPPTARFPCEAEQEPVLSTMISSLP